MVIRVSVPSRFQLKIISSMRSLLFSRKNEVHYIGGSDVLPAPLAPEREAEMIAMLGTEEEKEAKGELIEHKNSTIRGWVWRI